MIAAAYAGDPDLIAMVNGKDVYSPWPGGYYADSLVPEDLALPERSSSASSGPTATG